MKALKTGRMLPHPIPYQGSKRALTHTILRYFPTERVRLFEPFAGSAAVSLAAVANGLVDKVVLNDANVPLMKLWERIIDTPGVVASHYKRLWTTQLGDERRYYDRVRDRFNKSHNPDLLLYLLARCVKASVRYNSNGEFNQSPDNRRRGAKPETLANHIKGASQLLRGITTVRHGDFREALVDATPEDIIYMDPPYQGVCGARDSRYSAGVFLGDFVDALRRMNSQHLCYLVSYDGRTGEKRHGTVLPSELGLTHIEVAAGVSSQGTLLGREVETVESIYVSPALMKRLGPDIARKANRLEPTQCTLF